MAKKTKNSNLSLEERLERALIPNWDEPYKLPENWCWVYLIGGFAHCLDKHRKPVNASTRSTMQGDIPYYGATGQVGWINNYLTDDHLVLLGEDGAPFLNYMKNKAYVISGKAWVNNHAHILKSFYGNNSNIYLMHYLNIFDYHGYVNGSTRLKLTQESMRSIPVPLAPLAEQQRIIERIDALFARLDEAKEKVQEVVDGFESRKAAILHKAFSGELTKSWRTENSINFNEWQNLTLDDVAEYKKGPFGSSITKSMFVPKTSDAYKVYEQGNAIRKTLEYGSYYISQDKYDELKKFAIKPGDIIVSCAGTIGEIYKLPENCEAGVINQALMRVRTYSNINEFFFIYYFTGVLKGDVIGEANGTAIKNIPPFKVLKAMNILLPPLSEQNEIVALLDRFLFKEKQIKAAAETVINQIDTIKKAILVRAFRGKLGTNDPNEESAIELVKTILNENTNNKDVAKPTKNKVVIPKNIESLLDTKLEKKIVKLFYESKSQTVTIDEIMSVSFEKIHIIDALTRLEQQQIIVKLDKTNYSIKE